MPEGGCVSEIIPVQPDAMICEIDQLSWGCQRPLERLVIAIPKTVSESKTRSILAFQIHGKYHKSGYCVV